MTQVAPSLLSADFARLGEAVDMCNRSDASMIHIDVMDGTFVPNITIGFPIIKSLSTIARKPLDVHMMVTEPGRFVDHVAAAGAAIMNVHVEACTHLNRVIQTIRHAGMSPAVTLNPATPLCMVEEVLADVDMVLLMSVNPGFGGQKFIPQTIDKLRRLRGMIDAAGLNVKIEIDGGVNALTAPTLVEAGADILVAGSFVFGSADPYRAIHTLMNA